MCTSNREFPHRSVCARITTDLEIAEIRSYTSHRVLASRCFGWTNIPLHIRYSIQLAARPPGEEGTNRIE